MTSTFLPLADVSDPDEGTSYEGRRHQSFPPEPLALIRARREPYALNAGPQSAGVYFLFYRWALIYVGQSTGIASRLCQHWDARAKLFDGFAYVLVPCFRLYEVEQHYIRTHAPAFNIKDNPNRKRA